MVAARDEGLIAGVGLSNVSLDQLRHAAAGTDIVCLQNLFHLAFPYGASVLEECLRRGIAFVPFCPLGWPRGPDNPVLASPVVIQTAARLGITPAQVALRWLLQLAPNVLLIPGTDPWTCYHQPKQPPGQSGNGQGVVLCYAVCVRSAAGAQAATANTRAKRRGVCGPLRRGRPGRRSRPCVLVPGGDDAPASRAGKDGLPRRGWLGPQAAARSRAAVPQAAMLRAAVPRAAVPPVAARARHRPVPGG